MTDDFNPVDDSFNGVADDVDVNDPDLYADVDTMMENAGGRVPRGLESQENGDLGDEDVV